MPLTDYPIPGVDPANWGAKLNSAIESRYQDRVTADEELANQIDAQAAEITAIKDIPGTNVALMGASITYLSAIGVGVYETQTTYHSYFSNGAFCMANQFLGHRLRLLANFGVSGTNSAQILTQVASVLALPEKPAFVIIGEVAVNGGVIFGTETSAQIIANTEQMLTQLLAAGINVVLQTNASTTAANTAGKLLILEEVNEWIRQQNYRRGVIIADVAAVLTNQATALPRTNTTYDGTHWSNLGGVLAGKVLADAIRPFIGGSVDLVTTNNDTKTLADFNNPMMLSSTGAGLAAGVTGLIAPGWSASWLAAGTASVSKVPSTDSVEGEWQRVQMLTAGTLAIQMLATTDWVAGEKIVMEAEYRTMDWTSMNYLQASIFASNGDSVYDGNALSQVAIPSLGWGVLRTPVYTIPSGLTYIAGNVNIQGVSGIVDIRRARLRKVS